MRGFLILLSVFALFAFTASAFAQCCPDGKSCSTPNSVQKRIAEEDATITAMDRSFYDLQNRVSERRKAAVKTTIDVQVSAEVARPLATAIRERDRRPVARLATRIGERDRKPVAKIISVVRVRR